MNGRGLEEQKIKMKREKKSPKSHIDLRRRKRKMNLRGICDLVSQCERDDIFNLGERRGDIYQPIVHVNNIDTKPCCGSKSKTKQ